MFVFVFKPERETQKDCKHEWYLLYKFYVKMARKNLILKQYDDHLSFQFPFPCSNAHQNS